MDSSQNKSQTRGTRRKRSIEEGSRATGMHKRRSLRLQYSISLNIPMEDLDRTANRLNCYIEMPRQVFSLTYLDADATQNPESLNCLEELRNKRWQIFLAGHVYNFNFLPAQLSALAKTLTSALTVGFQKNEMVFQSEVIVADQFAPTENDHKALVITVTGSTEEKETLLYHGYMLSWCNPAQVTKPLLPLLVCRGNPKYSTLIHSVLSERFDLTIRPFLLTQEEFMHLSTYCLVMLDKNDPYSATLTWKIPSGTIQLSVALSDLLKLWNKIHKEDSNEVELDEILLFHEALEAFYESTYGIKLGHAHHCSMSVPKCFRLNVNNMVWFRSTRILHVTLKYLSHLAVQRLKVRALNSVNGSCLRASNMTL
uniref:Centromere protein L n=1 Tax=Graphocephala atropunctata TaxID=36148 RepID=A0A1B6L7Y6_9HEMI